MEVFSFHLMTNLATAQRIQSLIDKEVEITLGAACDLPPIYSSIAENLLREAEYLEEASRSLYDEILIHLQESP